MRIHSEWTGQLPCVRHHAQNRPSPHSGPAAKPPLTSRTRRSQSETSLFCAAPQIPSPRIYLRGKLAVSASAQGRQPPQQWAPFRRSTSVARRSAVLGRPTYKAWESHSGKSGWCHSKLWEGKGKKILRWCPRRSTASRLNWRFGDARFDKAPENVLD